MSDELLDALALLIVEVGDPFAGLALQFGNQTHDVLGGVADLLRPQEVLDEGLDELIEPGRQARSSSGETSA